LVGSDLGDDSPYEMNERRHYSYVYLLQSTAWSCYISRVWCLV
jgi:hypothetical protein